jgi:parvulin-like peptidyl-prolyl isomerase
MSWRYFLVALLVLAGCGPESKTADSAAVLATVAGKAITTLALDHYEQELPDYLRSKKEGVAAHRSHLQSLVDKELVLREARKRGLDQLPVLKHKISKMVNKRLVEELSREMVDAQLTITEEELRTAYDEQTLGWEIWPAHILSASEEDAREIIRLLDAGASFSELARARSLADDADKGGNLGAFFDQSGAVSSLRDGTFHLAEGQVSEPIPTIDGYEVIKVLKKQRIPFEQLRGDIATQLSRRKWGTRREAVIDSLKKAHDLRYHRDRIHAVLDGLHRRGLDRAQAQAPLVEYKGGAIKVGDFVQGLLDVEKGALPPDSAAVFHVLELWVIPDSLLALEARAQGLQKRADLVEWKEKKHQKLLASQLRLDEVEGRVEVTDAEVRSYYEKYLDTYKSLPGIIEMTEVLVDTRAEAEAILVRARAGERLEELAIRHSVRSGMKSVGGHTFADSGRVTIESLYQSPYRTFFGDSNSKDVGVLQGPLEVQEKYSVFRLDQPFEKVPLPFRQVQRPIRVDIRKGREGVLFNAFLDSLRRAEADQVQVNEEVLSGYAAGR